MSGSGVPTASGSLLVQSMRDNRLRMASSLARRLSLLLTTVQGARSVSVARNMSTLASV